MGDVSDKDILDAYNDWERAGAELGSLLRAKFTGTVREVSPLETEEAICSRIIDKFNRAAHRNLRWESYLSLVRRLLKKGFREADMRVVIWWTFSVWKPEGIKPHPGMLFKLQSGQGYRTFPEYLAEAIEAYEKNGNKWEAVDADWGGK